LPVVTALLASCPAVTALAAILFVVTAPFLIFAAVTAFFLICLAPTLFLWSYPDHAQEVPQVQEGLQEGQEAQQDGLREGEEAQALSLKLASSCRQAPRSTPSCDEQAIPR
jgi:hypothetical protein